MDYDEICSTLSSHQSTQRDSSTPSTRQKAKKTTDKQLEIYIDFAEKCPVILDNRNANYAAQWKELVLQLNKYGPEKTLEDWQKAMRSWGYHLVYEKKHSGGKSLKPLKERALAVIGKIRVHGDEEVAVLDGLGADDHSPPTPPMNVPQAIRDDFDEAMGGPSHPPKRRRNRGDEIFELINLIKEQKEDKEVREQQKKEREEQKIKIEKEKTQALKDFAQHVGVIAETLSKSAQK